MNVTRTQTTPGLQAGTRTGAEPRHFTDLYIAQGRIGRTRLRSACYSWGEVLHIAALELWRRGAARPRPRARPGAPVIRP
jgi:hypothetical protein